MLPGPGCLRRGHPGKLQPGRDSVTREASSELSSSPAQAIPALPAGGKIFKCRQGGAVNAPGVEICALCRARYSGSPCCASTPRCGPAQIPRVPLPQRLRAAAPDPRCRAGHSRQLLPGKEASEPLHPLGHRCYRLRVLPPRSHACARWSSCTLHLCIATLRQSQRAHAAHAYCTRTYARMAGLHATPHAYPRTHAACGRTHGTVTFI